MPSFLPNAAARPREPRLVYLPAYLFIQYPPHLNLAVTSVRSPGERTEIMRCSRQPGLSCKRPPCGETRLGFGSARRPCRSEKSENAHGRSGWYRPTRILGREPHAVPGAALRGEFCWIQIPCVGELRMQPTGGRPGDASRTVYF